MWGVTPTLLGKLFFEYSTATHLDKSLVLSQMFAIFVTNYIDMVQAYTLSDRIVQQGFNDAQYLVGRVYKNIGGTISVSSTQELLDSGAQLVPEYQQVCRYFYKESGETPPTCLKTLYNGQGNISDLLFDVWSDALFVNWVQLRRVEVNLILGATAPAVGEENYYVKLVFDVFQSPLNP